MTSCLPINIPPQDPAPGQGVDVSTSSNSVSANAAGLSIARQLLKCTSLQLNIGRRNDPV